MKMRLVERLSRDCERRRCFGFYKATGPASLETPVGKLQAQAMAWAEREKGLLVRVGAIKTPRGRVIDRRENASMHHVCPGGTLTAECAAEYAGDQPAAPPP